jgi:hypothetical protein
MRPIYTFVRHCDVSSNSAHKQRPSWFTKEKALINLINTKDNDTHIIIMLDTGSVHDIDGHFSSKYHKNNDLKVVPMHGGTDAHSFINMIRYILTLDKEIPQNAIIYLLEDDYVHKAGWSSALREAFDDNLADYVTLYDHNDKYKHPMYKGLRSELFVTNSCHWRTTPSTTNTYAMLYETLLLSRDDHIRFSDTVVGFTFDHAKFTFLHKAGKKLISSIPGLSTHVEEEFLSPITDWSAIM